MTVLFGSEKISGTPQLKIAHGDSEARAEFCVFPDSLKPFLGYFGKCPALRECKISICAARRSSYSSSDLMELRQPEPLRIVNYKRVGVRDIYPGFNDARTDKYIYLTRKHGSPYILKSILFHLAVRRYYSRFRESRS